MRDKRILFWLLLLVVVVMLNLPLSMALRSSARLRDGFEPFQKSLSLVMDRSTRFVQRLGRTQSLLQENQDLHVAVARLEHRVRELSHFERENETLRRQLGFSVLSPHRLLLCEVVTRGDLTGWWQTVRLNKGTRDGVAPGMAVMTTDGLVGRTITVSQRTTDVLLITDPNCKVSSTVGDDGAFGIVRGAGVRLSGRGKLEMLASVNPTVLNYVSTEHTLSEGDWVTTSGLGGVFPAGVPIGRLENVRLHESGLYQQADVMPAARLDAFRYAFIILEPNP